MPQPTALKSSRIRPLGCCRAWSAQRQLVNRRVINVELIIFSARNAWAGGARIRAPKAGRAIIKKRGSSRGVVINNKSNAEYSSNREFSAPALPVTNFGTVRPAIDTTFSTLQFSSCGGFARCANHMTRNIASVPVGRRKKSGHGSIESCRMREKLQFIATQR